MAKAWIRDRWLKSKAVVDGVELTPTTGMKRQVAANPDTADVPAALRTADYGRGMRWQVCWRADDRQHRESLPTREAAEARAAELNDDIRSGRYVDPRGGSRTLDEVFPLWLADHTGVRPATIDNYIRHYNGINMSIVPHDGGRPPLTALLSGPHMHRASPPSEVKP